MGGASGALGPSGPADTSSGGIDTSQYGAPPSSTPPGTTTPIGLPQGSIYGDTPGLHTPAGSLLGHAFWDPKGGELTAYGTQARGPGSITWNHNSYDYYVDGMEWAPLADVTTIPDVQQSLIQAGFLDPHKTTLGQWGQNSADAYRQILAFANHTGMTANDAMAFWVQHPKATSASAASAPGPFELHNQEDVRAAYRTAAESLVGGDLADSEAAQFSSQYQTEEIKARKAQADTMTKGTLTYTLPPDPNNAATAYIKAHHMDRVLGYGMASRMMEFYGMLKGV